MFFELNISTAKGLIHYYSLDITKESAVHTLISFCLN